MPESQSSPRDERAIEKQVTNYAIKQGCYVRKFTAPTRRYVPDCIFITSQGKAFFIEFKKRGGLATVQKQKEIKLLRKVNVEVYVVDSVEKGIQAVNAQIQNSPLAECDCDSTDPHDTELYCCADCGYRVTVCLGCWIIRRGCGCGACAEGKWNIVSKSTQQTTPSKP